MTKDMPNSPYTRFKQRSLLSWEDRETIRLVGLHLKNRDPIAAAKDLYWWSCNESWRLSPLHLWHRYIDHQFDRRHGLDTMTRVQITDMSVIGRNADHAVYYQASPVIGTRRSIQSLPIDPKEFTFIDIGSGKGRVLLLASELAFKRVVGVEFGKELHDIAMANIARYPNCLCRDVTSVHCDATEFSFPPDNIVVYFYNPFDLYIIDKVLTNLRGAIERSGKQAYIVYYHAAAPELFEDPQRFSILQKRRKYLLIELLSQKAA